MKTLILAFFLATQTVFADEVLKDLGFGPSKSQSSIQITKASEIAQLIVDEISKTPVSAKQSKRVAQLAAKLILLKPHLLTDEKRAEDRHVEEDPSKPFRFTQDYIKSLLNINLNQTVVNVSGDILYLISESQSESYLAANREKVISLIKGVNSYVEAMYQDSLVGRSGLLGYALSLKLLDHAKSQKNLILEKALAEELDKSGIDIESLKTGNVVVTDTKGRRQNLKLESGQIAKIKTPIGELTGFILVNSSTNTKASWFVFPYGSGLTLMPAPTVVAFISDMSIFQNKTPDMASHLEKGFRQVLDIGTTFDFSQKQGVLGLVTYLMGSKSKNILRDSFKEVQSVRISNKDSFVPDLQAFGSRYTPTVFSTTNLLRPEVAALGFEKSRNPDSFKNITFEYLQLLEKNPPIETSPKLPNSVRNIPEAKTYPTLGSKPPEALAKDYKSFLIRLGFGEYTKAMEANLKRAKSGDPKFNEMMKITLEDNIRSYGMIDAARELAIKIIAHAKPFLSIPENRARVFELVARLTALQSQNPPSMIMENIRALPEEKREKAISVYLRKSARDEMELHARRLTSDIIELLYGPKALEKVSEAGKTEIQELYTLSAEYLKRTYLDPQIGKTHFLGRALIALLMRHSILEIDKAKGVEFTNFRNELSPLLAARSQFFENYIGAQIVTKSEDGIRHVSVENGALILNRNINMEAGIIASSSLPENQEKAKRLRLNGKMMSALLAVDPKELEDGFSWLEKLRDQWGIQDTSINDGFSHIGYVIVRDDATTGLQMTWIVDNYPYAVDKAEDFKYGGVRFQGIEQYASYFHYSKIMVAKYDHTKLREWALTQSYPKDGIAFPSYKIKMGPDKNLVPPDEKVSQPWMTTISEDEFKKLMAISDPDLWYKKAANRAVDRMIEMMEEGVFFSWISDGMYYYGGTYCSQLGELVWLQNVGISIEKGFDFNSSLVSTTQKVSGFLKFLGVGDFEKGNPFHEAEALKSLHRLYSPSGLVAQDFVEETPATVDFRNRDILSRERSFYRPPDIELNVNTTRKVDEILGTQSAFKNYRIDENEMFIYKMRSLDYIIIRAASAGIIPYTVLNGYLNRYSK